MKFSLMYRCPHPTGIYTLKNSVKCGGGSGGLIKGKGGPIPMFQYTFIIFIMTCRDL